MPNRKLSRNAAVCLAAVAALAMPDAASAQPAANEVTIPELLPIDVPESARQLDSSRTVTLLTGHQVRVATGPDGKVTVSQNADQPAGPDAEPMVVRSEQKPGEAPHLTAQLGSAADLIESGAVDPQLFDISHLLGEAHSATSTPVTIHYGGSMTAQQTRTAADALPGSAYVEGSATDGSATVTVPTDAGADFWNAVTRPRTFEPDTPEGWAWKHTPPSTPRDLVDGVRALTLNGAAPTGSMAPNLDVPTYTFDLRVRASENPATWPHPDLHVILETMFLTPVTGPLTSTVSPNSMFCEDPRCEVMVARWVVPEGVYFAEGMARPWGHGTIEYGKIIEPEVRVNGDIALDHDVDDFTWLNAKTSKPSELDYLALTSMRHRPGRPITANLTFVIGVPFNTGMYLAKSRTTATTGSYNLTVNELRRQPRITMEVVTPKRTSLDLHSQYAIYTPHGWNDTGDPEDTRQIPPTLMTADDEEIEVVDVGAGTAADFEGADVAGKLAFMTTTYTEYPGNWCRIGEDVINRAHAAGARAIVVDPSRQPYHDGPDEVLPNPDCQEPVVASHTLRAPAKVALISIRTEEAQELRRLINAGRTLLRVDSPPAKPLANNVPGQRMEYLYELAHNFWGGVPADFDQTVDDGDLATRDTAVHANEDAFDLFTSAHLPESAVTAGTHHGFHVPGPFTITEHIGPLSTDLTRTREWRDPNVNFFATAIDKMLESSRSEERFNAAPVTFGPVEVDTPIEQGMRTCSFCRTGDELYPLTALTFGASPNHYSGGYGLLPDMILTTAGGQTIPMTSPRGIPVFELPSQTQRYTLRSTSAAGDHEWTFESGTAGDAPPSGVMCYPSLMFGESCGEAQPMIYVRYAAPVDLDNAAAAGSRHTVDVTAYHHGPNAPKITDVTTEVSFDGGETWTTARLRAGKDGTRHATFVVPALSATDGFVSLRTTARDADGNTTKQTRLHAYGLR